MGALFLPKQAGTSEGSLGASHSIFPATQSQLEVYRGPGGCVWAAWLAQGCHRVPALLLLTSCLPTGAGTVPAGPGERRQSRDAGICHVSPASIQCKGIHRLLPLEVLPSTGWAAMSPWLFAYSLWGRCKAVGCGFSPR